MSVPCEVFACILPWDCKPIKPEDLLPDSQLVKDHALVYTSAKTAVQNKANTCELQVRQCFLKFDFRVTEYFAKFE